MLIELTCPTCGATLRIDDEVAGVEWTCGGCRNTFAVASHSSAISGVPSSRSPARASTTVNAERSETVSLERVVVALDVAAWGAVCGIVGSVAFGLLLPLMRLIYTREAFVGPSQWMFSLYVGCMFIAFLGMCLEFAFLIASSLICKSCRTLPAAGTWGGCAFWLSVLATVASLVAMLSLFNPLRADLVFINSLSLVSVVGYLAAHGVLSSGFAAVAADAGRADVTTFSRTYWLLLVALSIWGAVSVFALEVSLDSDAALEPMTASQSAWLIRFVTVMGSIVHLYWFSTVARRTRSAVRHHQSVAA
jgi:hypothetical protein